MKMEITSFRNYLQKIDDHRFLHKDIDIPDEYKKLSLHVAIERADKNEDWLNFRKIFVVAPVYLKNHLEMCDGIFKFKYKNLDKEEQKKLFTY
jgi:hypothetical protein